MSRKVLSMLPWETVDEVMEEINMEVIKKNMEKGSSGSSDDSGMGDY